MGGTFVGKLGSKLRELGLGGALRYLAYGYFDRRWHRKTGFPLHPDVDTDSPGLDRGGRAYSSIRVRDFRRAMRHVDLTPEDVFLDFGSGTGRVLMMASEYPFRRVLGVELSEPMSRFARQQFERLGPFRSGPIEVIQGDAAQYVLPPDVTVLFFYNPFAGALLEKVIGNICSAIAQHPRRVTILFATPVHLEKIADRFPMLSRSAEFSGYHRWAIYDVVPAKPSGPATK